MNADNQLSQKRIRKKIKQPNPLFEKWLKEWQHEARDRGSDVQYCYAKALNTLKKYPLPLKNGKECRILQNFGTKICDMLDRKLEEFRQIQPEEYHNYLTKDVCISPHTSKPKTRERRKSKSCGQIEQNAKFTKLFKNRATAGSSKLTERGLDRPVHELSSDDSEDNEMNNLPTPCEHMISGYVERSEINVADVTTASTYTHHSDMGSVMHGEAVNYDLNIKSLDQLAPDLFSSSELNLENNGAHCPSTVRCASALISSSSFTMVTEKAEQKRVQEELRQLEEPLPPFFNRFKLPGGSFRIVLLVDVSETTGNHVKHSRGALIAELKRLKLNVEVRHLNVGDFAWICQDSNTMSEAVLPYIVERKRMDDFAKSIKDGRFHEQKFRLKKCGIQHLIYLVESHGNNQHLGLPLSTIGQAAANTQIVDEFVVARTSGQLGTISYLSSMTSFISRTFKEKMIMSCPKDHVPPLCLESSNVSLMTFNDFNSGAKKKMQYKVKEMFIKQLVQLNGMSISKAVAIVQMYPSPAKLMKAYAGGGGEDLMSDIFYGKTRRKIGPSLSKTIYQFYTSI